MYWKYLFVTVLLVSSNRIFIRATFQGNSDRLSPRETDDQLLDDIVDLLSPDSQNVDKKTGTGTGSSDDTGQVGTQTDTSGNSKASGKTADAAAAPKPNSGSSVHAAPGQTAALHQEQKPANEQDRQSKVISDEDKRFLMIFGGGVAACFIGLMLAGVCYYKFRRNAKAASDVEYPAYGVTGPMKERIPSPGDRKLAQSAQMYHYQHQKQQMIAMEKANGDMKHDASDDDSEEDNVEGDYTVYECPGLAPIGEMEVKNPFFRGDQTPATPGQDGQEDLQDQGRSPSDQEK